MALSIATIKAVIKTKRETAFGPPDDPILADASYTADAETLFEVLTVQASVAIAGGGIDTNGDTLVTPTGVIL